MALRLWHSSGPLHHGGVAPHHDLKAGLGMLWLVIVGVLLSPLLPSHVQQRVRS